MFALIPLSGAAVGLSLGLTGGGGSIFAVPLLIYGLGIAPREAVGVSLAAVGVTALVGAVGRLRAGQVEIRIGFLFAAAGMLGTPAGAWLGGRIPEPVLLVLFAALMVAVAARMWRKATRHPEETRAVRAAGPSSAEAAGPACRRDPSGRLAMTSRCAVVLAAAGLVTGVLSGLFGVGGGFVIVPALVLTSGLDIHRAVATSLLVIALVGVAGVASYLAAGRPLPWGPTGLFVAGGVAGMGLGTLLARRISGPGLQKIFAAAMLVVAAFIVTKSIT